MSLCSLMLSNGHQSVVGFCVLSTEVPEGSAAELRCRVQSQRLFTRTLLPRRHSFVLGTGTSREEEEASN